jgi:SWI/SNF-related matrix-associated actin-dependent regulator 1 of chromatin subfamily A
VEFGVKNFGRLLLGDEMGVGKTIQALGICAAYYSEWPVLIICPATLKYNWKAEIMKFLDGYLDKKTPIDFQV